MKTDTQASIEWDGRVKTAGQSVLQRIAEAPIEEYPCLHMVIDNIFPQDIYYEIQRHWPPHEAFQALNETGLVSKGAYKARSVLILMNDVLPESLAAIPEHQRSFWSSLAGWLNSQEFILAMLIKCRASIEERFGDEIHSMRFGVRPQLVMDDGEYSLGPHTDIPSQIITMLFYMPPDETVRDQGTSLYLPKNRDFRCNGGPHYSFSEFDRIMTADFQPNRLFMFIKNNASWHGVEPMVCDGRKRRVLSVKIGAIKNDEH